ncbi:hypothetical protein RB195_002133 [Necator americanus]|uniref:Uncharacterized protein n=1 Tax=Necator americanus TaxID=51031 RepID=A0ABR1DHI1_NECAM
MASDSVAPAPPEPETGPTQSEDPVEPATEQVWSELCELYLQDGDRQHDDRITQMDSFMRPKCNRCIVFRDNCVHYLNVLTDLAPRIPSLEALIPENALLKKQNADLTTQLEESIQGEQTLRARVTAAEEETLKVKETLESLEKNHAAVVRAAEEGKRHAHEASVWRVKYEKTLVVCERIQEKRKKQTINFDKMLDLAEGYKRELELTKVKACQEREQHAGLHEAVKKYTPRLYTLLKDIMAHPSFKTIYSANIQEEAETLCSADVRKAFNLSHSSEDEDDGMSAELERLVNANSSPEHPKLLSELPLKSELNTTREVIHSPAAKSASVAVESVLSMELNDDEADDLLSAGAEALTMLPANVATRGTRGKARGRGSRRGRDSRHVHTPTTFATTINHEEVTRRCNEILESKLKRSTKHGSEPCSSGMKHLSIHGKKTLSIREQQEAQMKISVKEKVAILKKSEEVRSKVGLNETKEQCLGSDSGAREAYNSRLQSSQIVSMDEADLSVARNDLTLSASPSPASSTVEGETLGTVDGDAIDLLALEELGIVYEDGVLSNAKAVESDKSIVVGSCGSATGLEASTQNVIAGDIRLIKDGVHDFVNDAEKAEWAKPCSLQQSCDIEDETMNADDLATRNAVEKRPDKACELQPSPEEIVAAMEDISTLERNEEMLNAESGQAHKNMRANEDQQSGEETSFNTEDMIPNSEGKLVEPLPERASSTADDKSTKVFVKPPKPHLAKETKRALGLMRRLEVDLKEKVEPIPEFRKKTKRTSRERLRRESVENCAKFSGVSEATSSANESTHAEFPCDREDVIDHAKNATSLPSLESNTIAKDHEEAMRLHAQLNLPSLRARKEAERDNSVLLGLSKSEIGVKERDKRRRLSQTGSFSGKSSPIPENVQRIESKPTKPKEARTAKSPDANDISESILDGAKFVDPTNEGASPLSSNERAKSAENVGKGRRSLRTSVTSVTKATTVRKSQSPISDSQQTFQRSSHFLRSSNDSRSRDVLPTNEFTIMSPKPHRGSAVETKSAQPKSRIRFSAEIPQGNAETRTRTPTTTSSTPFLRFTRRSTAEENAVLPPEDEHFKVQSILTEPRPTRSNSRRNAQSLTSSISTRRSSVVASENSNEQTDNDLKRAAMQIGHSLVKKQEDCRIRSARSSRKRTSQNDEVLSVSVQPSTKRLKTLSVQLQADSTPTSRTRKKVDVGNSRIETLEQEPSSRVISRTGPVAPRRRKINDEPTVTKSVAAAETLSETSTDDESRLCVADDEDERTQEVLKQPATPATQMDDDDGRLVIDNDEDEERKEIDIAKKKEDNPKFTTVAEAAEIYNEKTSTTSAVEEGKNSGGSAPGVNEASTGNCSSIAHPTVQSIRRDRSGVLQFARRSAPSISAGPAAMQKSGSRIAKQLQKSGGSASPPEEIVTATSGASNRREKEQQHSSSAASVSTKKSSEIGKGFLGATNTRVTDNKKNISSQLAAALSSRKGKKRRPEGPAMGNDTAIKKIPLSESLLQKKLHGALMSEQNIEVIRKNLGEAVDEIGNMDPEEFASTMIKCSLNLPSGDMWTIVQANYRSSESQDIRNKKEDSFMNIAKELSRNNQIWEKYVKKMVTTMTTQAHNVVNTTRYIRLLSRALYHAGSLLTDEEKRGYLRAALTRLFLDDTGVAIKAAIYALLSPSSRWLDWMSDKNDPFSLLLSIAVTATPNDGKILLWAWFQQFPEELQLQDVSIENLRRAFDELMARLDELAGERGRHLEEDNQLKEITEKETTVMNMAIAYFFPGSESTNVVKTIVANCMSDCVNRVKMALKPRATQGEEAWAEAFAVSTRLRLCIHLTLKAIGCRDNSPLSRDFCSLLQYELLTIRDLRDEIEKLTLERPWVEVYRNVVFDVLSLVQTLSQYEL